LDFAIENLLYNQEQFGLGGARFNEGILSYGSYVGKRLD
jgi:hypothetical protein